MATCRRCGTIMAAVPGAKCPACGAINDPLPAPAPAPDTTVEPRAEAPSAVRPVPAALDQVALGYNLVIYAALALLAAIVLGTLHNALLGGLNLLCFLLALAGVLLMATGMGWSSGLRIVLAVLMFIPIVNLVTAMAMIAKASMVLKGAGRRIGFLGVKR
jgi:hypothetical protein